MIFPRVARVSDEILPDSALAESVMAQRVSATETEQPTSIDRQGAKRTLSDQLLKG